MLSLRVTVVLFATLCCVAWHDVAADGVGNQFDAIVQQGVGADACFRMVNADAAVGCSTPTGGLRGLMFHVSSAARLTEYRSLEDHNRAVLLPAAMVNPTTIAELQTPLLAGIVILTDAVPSEFSPSERAPKGGLHAQADYPWNGRGLDMLQTLYEFPIVTTNVSESTRLIDLAEQNHAKQGGFPQHALDFNFEMGPPNLRSVSCLLNGQCLPLGGQSVWGTMGPPGTKKIVLAAARLDSVALFHDRAYGGQAEASDIVTLLAVVDALSKVDTSSLPLAIGFGLFQGENWGQIGSRRFVTEVANFTCTSLQPAATSATGKAFCRQPLRTDLTFANLTGSSFHQVIAIDQSGVATTDTYLHSVNGAPTTVPTLLSVMNAAAATGSPLSINAATSQGLPPSPATAFARAWPGVHANVFSSYNQAYGDKLYHSQFDNAPSADQVTAFATSLARTLYAVAADKPTAISAGAAVPSSLQADATLVADLLTCFTKTRDCQLFADVLGVGRTFLTSTYGTGPLSLYTGVYSQPRAFGNGYVLSPSLVEIVTRSFLGRKAAATDRGGCTSMSECKLIDPELECLYGRCVVSTVHYHEALSSSLTSLGATRNYFVSFDALEEPHADRLWAEPYWSTTVGVQLYQAGSPSTDVVILLVGIAVAAASVAGMCYMKKGLRRHFKVL